MIRRLLAAALLLLPHLAWGQATALTVTDIAANRVVQRAAGGTTVDLALAGTFTGSPTGIKCEVDIVGGGTALAATAMTGYSHGGSTWAGTCPGIPQGAWYTIKVIDSLNSGVTATGSNHWGVGVLVCTIGQSNMVNLGTGTNATVGTYTKAIDWSTTTWEATNATVGGTGGGYSVLANTIQQFLGGTVPVGIVVGAQGGTLMSDWLSVANGGNNGAYFTFVTAFGSAPTDCEIAIWQQGESNAHNALTGVDAPSAYFNGMALLHQQLLTTTGRSSSQFKFGVASLGACGSCDDAASDTVRTAQIQYGYGFPGALAGAFYAGSMYDMPPDANGVLHWMLTAYDRAAWRYAHAAATAIGSASASAVGPSIGTRQWPVGSSTITLTVNMNGSASLRDGQGNTNCSSSSGAGWVLAGTSATISALSCSGSTITITTSANRQVSDTPTLTYAAGHNPFNYAGTGSDNDNAVIYDNSGSSIGWGTGITDLGWPLQPTQGALSIGTSAAAGGGGLPFRRR